LGPYVLAQAKLTLLQQGARRKAQGWLVGWLVGWSAFQSEFDWCLM
jgi:hypothetical protein